MIKSNIKYINIPNNILFDTNIPPLAKIIYGEIKLLSYQTGICNVSNQGLAELNNCSTRTISRMIKILKDNKYINSNDEFLRKIKLTK